MYLDSIPNKLHVEECKYGASVSEEWSKKVAGSINFLLDRFKIYEFGVEGAPLTYISVPKIFTENIEYLDYNYYIEDFEVFFENCGTSGSTIFSIEKYNSTTSSWSSILSFDVPNTASDLLRINKADLPGLSGITANKYYLDTDIFVKDTKLRFVLTSVATDAINLSISLKMRPSE